MPPIEVLISTPSINKKIVVENGQVEHFRRYDLSVYVKGDTFGGNCYTKHDSQPKSKEFHINSGEIIERTCKVITKGGVLEKIKITLEGKDPTDQNKPPSHQKLEI